MTTSTQTQPPVSNSSFADMFKPIMGGVSNTGTAPVNIPGGDISEAATPGSVPAGSAASASGAVDPNSVFSSLDHTKIASVSGDGLPGAGGAGSQNPQASVSLGGMVQGEWAVNIMDAILPAAMVAGFYAFGVKLRKTELQLTQAEKNTLAPIMQKCLDTVLLNFTNPWNALLVTLAAIYGGKAMEKGLITWIDKSQANKEQEALQEKIKKADMAMNPAVYDASNQSAHDLQNNVANNLGGEISEEDIRAAVKKWKIGREKAIERLKRNRGIK